MRANQMDKAIVSWADGTHDIQRHCVMCANLTCSMPVHTEKYKTVKTGHIDPILEQGEVEELHSMGISMNYSGTRRDALDTVVAKEDQGDESSNEIE